MSKVIAVIGANYGDEGKGTTVHHLVGQKQVRQVIKTNGGPQAGHTVKLTDGRRHVFSTYGSGTFRGAQTYLSEDFLFNPEFAKKEYDQLEKLTKVPLLSVDPEAQVTTIWDIVLNQFLEKGRGPERHGSCGMGIGETMLRITTPGAPTLKVRELMNLTENYNFSRNMRDWFKSRLKEELSKESFKYLTLEEQKALQELLAFPTLLAVEFMILPGFMTKTLMGDFHPLSDYIVAEASQGLLLDQDDPDHQPHTTWSKTGIHNIIKFCKKNKLDLAEIYYVTRPYITRHGAGPILAGIEIDPRDVQWTPCETNKPNDYQGSLRYAHLDWGMFYNRIEKDSQLAKKEGYNPKVNVSITCSDHLFCTTNYLYFNSTEKDYPEGRMLTSVEALKHLQERSPYPVTLIDGRNG